jgi:hypothetical protein
MLPSNLGLVLLKRSCFGGIAGGLDRDARAGIKPSMFPPIPNSSVPTYG